MKVSEFKNLPKGAPDVGKAKIGYRFRVERSEKNEEMTAEPGQMVCFYEVFVLKEKGFEYGLVWERLEKD